MVSIFFMFVNVKTFNDALIGNSLVLDYYLTTTRSFDQ